MTHSITRRLLLASTVALGGAISATALSAETIKVGFITALSGPIASQGIPTAKGIAAGQHAFPTAGGHNIEVIQLDDASDPSQSIRNGRKLIESDNVDVLVGTSGVPGAMALASLSREAQVPYISYTPLFLSGKDAEWAVTTAQPADLMLNAVVDDMANAGIKSVGYIGFSDSWGDLAFGMLNAAAEKNGMEIISDERYARSDTSVTGQVLRIVSGAPEAVIGGTAGTPGALPYLALSDRGFTGAIYGTHGIINPDFVRVAGPAANGLRAPTGPIVVAEQLPDSHPSKAVAQTFKDAYRAVYGEDDEPDAFSAYAFDVWRIIADAAERVPADIEPGTPDFRTALRDAIFATNELPVTHGVLNFTEGSPYGADTRSVVMVELQDGKWMLRE
ncbi:branched-chain amino acid ABC transporter substrate-binding protein [Ruegeria marisrubri]|uniref:Branched-chain amino acid ABC transporter substrate-binding protein n=1 Tax=Ruegeria marisrubri TaxID=1685379 RepID=A0A0X3U5X8_9RHOB|nr:ABC transporter substrate-binding protein [Ruegeria marisrubri]KUJ83202.1 branched-chain amino acid ABC transporter substrate-binding protein [Ruegeria marisrubri]